MRDLREERPRGAENEDGFVPGLLPEQSRDLFRRFGEIGGHGDMGLAGRSLRRERQQKRRQRERKTFQLQDDLRPAGAPAALAPIGTRGYTGPLYLVIHTAAIPIR